MEPIVFHPGGNDNKPKMESQIRPVDIVNSMPAKTPAPEAVTAPQFDGAPPESHHKEILPSLAIPDGTTGKKLKARSVKGFIITALLTYILVTAAGIAAVTLLK